MKKISLLGLFILYCVVATAQGTAEVFIDEAGYQAGYRVLSEEEKTAECFYVQRYIQDLVIRPKVTINSQEYTVTSIADNTVLLWVGEKITSLTLPNTLKHIGSCNFLDCPITDLQLPSSLEYIGDESFGLELIPSIFIPASLKCIRPGVFNGCINCTSIIVDEKNPVYDSRDNCNAIIETANNQLIVGCQATVVPSTVTAIGAGSFSYCSNLKSITLPDHVNFVGRSAFGGCYNLSSITILSAIPPQAENDIIQDAAYKKAVLYVPEGTKATYQATPIWGKFSNIKELDSAGLQPISGITYISTPYDLQGRRLTSKPTKGIYIQNGKKVMVK